MTVMLNLLVYQKGMSNLTSEFDISLAKRNGNIIGERTMAERILRMIEDNKANTDDVSLFCKHFLEATEDKVKENNMDLEEVLVVLDTIRLGTSRTEKEAIDIAKRIIEEKIESEHVGS